MTNSGEIQDLKTQLLEKYTAVRRFTEQLCEPLEKEDFVVQSMPDVSPTRWHLAHTAWFFEIFILKPMLADYQTPNELYNYLFNSYYNAVGEQFPRNERGHLSRPTVDEVFAYRHHVDDEIIRLFETLDEHKISELESIFVLGLQHEQQHQELMLTDIKHVFFQNPIYPAYVDAEPAKSTDNYQELNWTSFEGGQVQHGFSGSEFSFDNETPRHAVFLHPFELGNRLVTNREYLSFIKDGGYNQPALWLSDGWALINKEGWIAPLYWLHQENQWFEFTLSGLVPLNLENPVTHLSYYEADAYANWCGARLPSEHEWEIAAQKLRIDGNFVQTQHFHPAPAEHAAASQLSQMFGDVWEWTRSPYTPYPGFKSASGAVGEYNGKFMSSQMVLRGGSCISSSDHLRSTYRNFFYPHSRWQFMGIRLARDV
ncbi:MAG: ergothioneine biosynthesis protein EgtB [FCB group bacterium]|nr:ergothioneine biosynthesis protein EgtB [FCB group bacterium]MBL7028417.1 ergothioneine biosynthesis protein EgtB [Candidatus Neomarinimicrobiota bacterium]MBL7122331.1 ergothioneine biosynthesis protein EgtB [Candidatus Neomarinimicrobiota bacterium]